MNDEIVNRILKCVDVEYAVDIVQKMAKCRWRRGVVRFGLDEMAQSA